MKRKAMGIKRVASAIVALVISISILSIINNASLNVMAFTSSGRNFEINNINVVIKPDTNGNIYRTDSYFINVTKGEYSKFILGLNNADYSFFNGYGDITLEINDVKAIDVASNTEIEINSTSKIRTESMDPQEQSMSQVDLGEVTWNIENNAKMGEIEYRVEYVIGNIAKMSKDNNAVLFTQIAEADLLEKAKEVNVTVDYSLLNKSDKEFNVNYFWENGGRVPELEQDDNGMYFRFNNLKVPYEMGNLEIIVDMDKAYLSEDVELGTLLGYTSEDIADIVTKEHSAERKDFSKLTLGELGLALLILLAILALIVYMGDIGDFIMDTIEDIGDSIKDLIEKRKDKKEKAEREKSKEVYGYDHYDLKAALINGGILALLTKIEDIKPNNIEKELSTIDNMIKDLENMLELGEYVEYTAKGKKENKINTAITKLQHRKEEIEQLQNKFNTDAKKREAEQDRLDGYFVANETEEVKHMSDNFSFGEEIVVGEAESIETLEVNIDPVKYIENNHKTAEYIFGENKNKKERSVS